MTPRRRTVPSLVVVVLLASVAATFAPSALGSPFEPASNLHAPGQATDTITIAQRLFMIGASDPVGAYRSPDSVAVDERSDVVYVSDTANHRITAHTADGRVLGVIGGRGRGAGQLLNPLGIDVAPDGTIYVADNGNSRVQRFDQSGKLLTAWGRQGAAEGEFGGAYGGRGPVDIAVGRSGSVYVADEGNGRLQQFTPDGTFVRAWNSWDCGRSSPRIRQAHHAGLSISASPAPSPLRSTAAMTSYEWVDLVVATAPDGSVYAGGAGGIARYTADGACQFRFGGEGIGPGRFGSPGPYGIDVAADGEVLVADGGWGRVQRFSPEGEFRGLSYTPGGGPNDVAVGRDDTTYLTHPGHVELVTRGGEYISHWGHRENAAIGSDEPRGVTIQEDGTVWVASGDRLQKYTADGAFLGFVGSAGDAPGRLSGAAGTYVSSAGYVYVADSRNDRIQVFDAAGHSTVRWGGTGGGGSSLDGPVDVASYASSVVSGRLAVSDSQNHRLSVFHNSGAWLGDRGSAGSGPEQLDTPMGIATTSSGFWVADSGNHRVVFYNPFEATRFVGARGQGPGQLESPADVALATDNTMYVADTGNDRVQVFDRAGIHIDTWGGEGRAAGRFRHPQGLARSPSGDVYVADSGNYRIQRFSPAGALTDSWPTFGWARDTLHGVRYNNYYTDTRIDVAGSADGRIFAVNFYAGTLQSFGSHGEFEDAWPVRDPIRDDALPYGIATSPAGQVLVLTTRGAVLVYESDGTLSGRWPVTAEEYSPARDLAVSNTGEVFVLSYDNDSPHVQRHAADGALLGQWPLTGGDPGNMSPITIEVGPDGSVYTVDEYGRTVERHTPTGQLLDRWSTGGSPPAGDYPYGIAVDSSGAVYVSRLDLPELLVFGPDGSPRGRLATPGHCDGDGAKPGSSATYSQYFRRRLDTRPDGTLLVAWASGCVETYSTNPAENPTWRIERYPNEYLAESPTVVEEVDVLDMDWDGSSDERRLPPKRISSRLEKRFHVDDPMRLDVDLESRGGVRLWVDELLMIDAWDEPTVAVMDSVQLDPGHHRILVHHRDHDGSSSIRLDDRLAAPGDPPAPTRTPRAETPSVTPATTSTATVGESPTPTGSPRRRSVFIPNALAP